MTILNKSIRRSSSVSSSWVVIAMIIVVVVATKVCLAMAILILLATSIAEPTIPEDSQIETENLIMKRPSLPPRP